MRIKLLLALSMVLLIAALLWINRPSPAPVIEIAPSVRTTLPALPTHFAGTTQKPSVETQATNLFRDVLLKHKEFPKLTPEQAEAYLLANHRNAESLLTAMFTTGNRAYVREAMTNFPNDPKVNYAALFFGNLTPEEMRQQADNFKRVAPDNAMANYASAINYMKSGQAELALQDMNAASNLKWNDYSTQFIQSSQEAYRNAGHSDLDALAAASSQLLLPDLAPLKQLSKDLATLATSYQQAGDPASAQTTLQMDMRLGQQLSATDAQPLITTLVGYAVEKIALGAMDPGAPYGDTGQTVQDQINQINQQRAYIKSLTSQSETLESMMSDEDFLNFYQRRQSFGEINALQWAANKYGQP